MEWQHIIPKNDWIEHKDFGLDCICEPKIDWEYMLVIHNSFDGRELEETLKGKRCENGYHKWDKGGHWCSRCGSRKEKENDKHK